MRFRSSRDRGFQIFAVSGTNTVSFGINATQTARDELLGFAIERFDPKENERYFMPGFKVFPSVIPTPDYRTQVSTYEHPVQSFIWDDFTAKPDYEYEYYFHPVRGKPRNLDRSTGPIKIEIQTEPLFSKLESDIFFNRGVASSQAYARRFGNEKPDDMNPKKAEEALQWLSRELDEAILKFIRQAKSGDTLLCCFYEFRYPPVAVAIKEAIDRGVEAKLIVDAKVNEYTDDKGVFHESFPRVENLKTIRSVKIPKSCVIYREARTAVIQHNKFMVLLKGKSKRPTEVWTGSTNISTGGIHGQTNVGHWLRNSDIAESYSKYWDLLATDPGASDGDSSTEARKKNADFRKAVEDIFDAPVQIDDVQSGVTPVFSPRNDLDLLDLYVSMVDNAQDAAYVTLAFGINKAFKEQLKDNTSADHIIFMLLEKQDKPNPRSKEPFVAINAKNNVYKAFGSFLPDTLYQWARETNNRKLQFNSHVSYIHSKFLIMDPLSTDPIVVTGSANFSDNSSKENDENMLIIRGDQRVADIYLTEFNRLFNHYYFRSVVEQTQWSRSKKTDQENLFLRENASEWLSKYAQGSLKQKRLDLYLKMDGFAS